jgi:putative ABC transport system permease protein
MPAMRTLALMFDLRSAWRGVRLGGFASLTAVISLTLGVAGAVTAGAVAYSGLVRPLPFPRSSELVTLGRVYTPTAIESGIKLSQFDEWRSRLENAARVAAYSRETATAIEGGAPREIQAAYTLGAFFDLFGVAPEYGRTFNENDALDVAIVSHDYAVSFAGSPFGALNRSLNVAGRPLRVIGVMPPRFSVLGNVALWTPARGVQSLRVLGPDDARDYTIVARLSPTSSIAEFRTIAQVLVRQAAPVAQQPNWQARVTPMRDELLGNSRPVLLVFAGASCLVLLIASANVSMLLINLVVSRSREFAVKLALGASRTRLLRTIFLETSLIVIAGGSLGWWVAIGAIRVLSRETALGLPALATSMNAMPLGAGVVAVCVLIVVVCSTAPVLIMRHAHFSTPLRAGMTTGSPASRRFRSALVVAQLATAIVLLVGAGLLGKTLWILSHTSIGLDASRRVVTMALPIGQGAAPRDAVSKAAFTARLLEAVRRLPGVETAGVGSNLPPSGSQILFTVRVTTSNNDRDTTRKFDLVSASEGYLEALGARVVQGRLFTAADALSDQPVVVLSESALQHLGMTGHIIDRELIMALPSASGRRERPRILGVIQDIRHTGLDAPANGGFYVLWRQIPTARPHLVVRTVDSRAVIPSLLPIVRSLDPSLPLSEPQMLDDVVDRSLAPQTARFGLVGVYAGAAALLALVGLSGALMRSVVERERDLAVRVALGAAPDRLVAAVVRHGLLLTAAGTVLGVLASALVARAASTIIFGVTPHDPVTYAAAVGGVFAIALAACYFPARRAAAADPIVLLRSE